MAGHSPPPSEPRSQSDGADARCPLEHRSVEGPDPASTAAGQPPAANHARLEYLTLPMPFVPHWDGIWPLSRPTQTWPVPRHLLQHLGCLVTLMPQDNGSMSPVLLGGDAILIDHRAKVPRSRSLVLLRAGDTVLVRRCIHSGIETTYVPHNPHHTVLKASTEVPVLGRVIGIVGRKFTGNLVIC